VEEEEVVVVDVEVCMLYRMIQGRVLNGRLKGYRHLCSLH
jgi:hypothetical protein